VKIDAGGVDDQALNHARCELLEAEPSALSDAAIDEEVRRVPGRWQPRS
jgi:hypothetical protein